jgi:hypothetical protein
MADTLEARSAPIPIYASWKDVDSDTLATLNQLNGRDLKPAPAQLPAAMLAFRKECYKLYAIAEAVPIVRRPKRLPASATDV